MNPNASPFFPSHYSLDSRTKSNSRSNLNPHAPEYTPKLVQGFKNPNQETCDDLKHDFGRAGLSERQLSYIYDSEEKFDEPNLKAFKYWQNLVPPPLLRQKGIFERGKVMELRDVELREHLEKAWAMLDLHTDGTKRMQERIIYLQGLIKSLEEELEIEKKAHVRMNLEKTQIASERKLYRKEKLKNKLLEENCLRLDIQLASEKGASRREQLKQYHLREKYEEATEKIEAMAKALSESIKANVAG